MSVGARHFGECYHYEHCHNNQSYRHIRVADYGKVVQAYAGFFSGIEGGEYYLSRFIARMGSTMSDATAMPDREPTGLNACARLRRLVEVSLLPSDNM